MRILTVALLLGMSTALGQATVQEPSAEQVVHRVLSEVEIGIFTSWDEKQLCKLGDAAAVEVVKQTDGKNLSRNEIKQILLLLRASFQAPLQIKVEADRQPREATLLLERLEELSVSSDLKEELVGTRKALKRASKVRAGS